MLGLLGLAVLVGLLLGMGSGNDGGYQPSQPAPWPGWKVVGLGALALVGLLAVGLVSYTLFRLLVAAHAAWREQIHRQEKEALALQQMANQMEADRARAQLEAALVRSWDAHGRLPALVRQTAGGWQVVNLDAEAGALLLRDGGTVDRILADPLTLAQLQARHDLEKERARASALPGLTTYSPHLRVAESDLSREALTPAVAWPEQVWLRDLVPTPTTLGGLVLGVTVGDDGQPRPVTAALSDLVHVAVGGSSGWGKSVFLRALALQLATAAETCRLALIDLEGTTFAPFAMSDRLLWPVADTEASALRIMAALVDEMNRRKALYAAYPGVDSLKAYNRKSTGNGDQALSPVVTLIDEATALLADRSVHNATRTLALRARKYGIWLVLGGQDWKAASVDTAIRNQLSTRVHFKAQSASQSRVLLGDGCAAAIETPGRAYAQLPGRPLTEIQAPLVVVADIETALSGQKGPGEDLPGAEEVTRRLSTLEAQLVLWAVTENEGRFSVRAVADAHPELVSRGQVQALADRLAFAGWLTMPTKAGTAPRVTADLEAKARSVLSRDRA